MRILFLLLIALISYTDLTAQQTVRWYQVYRDAELTSRKSNKLLLLYFWHPLSESCRTMDIETWSKDTVVSMANQYIPTRINLDNDPDLLSRFGVSTVPAIVIADSYGIILERIEGLRDNFRLNDLGGQNNASTVSIPLSKISRLLMRYPKDIRLINAAQEKYASSDNKLNALFDLSEAYLLTSTIALNSAKTNFITESQTFLRRTKKLLKKSKSKRYQQLFEIHDISQDTYRTKPEKGLKALLAYQKKNTIDPKNQAFVHTTLFLTYKRLKQRSKAAAELEALKTATNNEKYLVFIESVEPEKTVKKKR